MSALRFKLLSIECYERPVTLRMPFRFGAATVTRCPQAFVKLKVQVEGHGTGSDNLSEGASAELMVPKWFDKNPALTHDDNFDQLRKAVHSAAEGYQAIAGKQWHSAYDLSQAYERGLQATAFLPRLAAQFGPALLDKAIADALLLASKLNWREGLHAGVLGEPYSAKLKALHQTKGPTSVFLRHTVGLADRLNDGPVKQDWTSPNDGLPETLAQAIDRYGLRYFKLKLCGQLQADLDRLSAIEIELCKVPDYRVTLDGNETFENAESLMALWSNMSQRDALREMQARTLLIEQPINRNAALSQDLRALNLPVPIILDESDDAPDVLERGLALGYGGISSKACKGIYRALASAWQCQEKSALLSGEDLTCQAGLAVQQDTLLAATLGVKHIERNGHHYVDGFGIAPPEETEAFANAHPELYEWQAENGKARLRVRQGQLALGSLYAPGFASTARPIWSSLQTMPNPASKP